MMNRVRSTDWSIKNMPEAFEETLLNRALFPQEYEALKLGFRPVDMDDRWLMYTECDWVYLHRSWTGFCIFKAKLEQLENGVSLTVLLINRTYDQYKSTNLAADKAELNSVLNSLIARTVT